MRINRLSAKNLIVVLSLLLFSGQSLTAGQVIQADVCVFGGTSGGAIAAVAAARLGKNVALVCVNNHVGGMTSSGLGVTDVGTFPSSIGGFAAEFYSRVGQAYGSTNPVHWFEPHVAEQTFLQMLNGAGVAIYTNQQLASVTMSNLYIAQITMTDGKVYLAKEFIDASYEGDLMAQSGVSYTWDVKAATFMESPSPGFLSTWRRIPAIHTLSPAIRQAGCCRSSKATPGHEWRRRPADANLQFSSLPDAKSDEQDPHHRAGELFRGNL
jgi:hypothetical protein